MLNIPDLNSRFHRLSGDAANPTTVGGGTFDLRVSQNIRATFTQSAVLAPGAGTYNIGLCGKADGGQAVNWNSNEYGYVSAVVF